MNEFLLEIGVEEMPAIPLLKELPNVKSKWHKALCDHFLDPNSEIEFFYTPRRLVFMHKNFAKTQKQMEEEFFGAPINIAFNDGKPTKAALGFAKKCGVGLDEITTTKKGNQEVLYYKKASKPKPSKDLMALVIKDFLNSLSFPKKMRSRRSSDEFIRPIKWIVALLHGEFLDLEVFDVRSSNHTFGHRNYSFEPQKINVNDDYVEFLSSIGVLTDKKREQKIKTQIQRVEQGHDIQVQVDKQLFDECVAITEFPALAVGFFDEKFLQLPQEAIVTSMKENQRYFACFKNGKLANAFVYVANSLCEDLSLITSGNERVLRPRLYDAQFFYDSDLKRGLDKNSLANLGFVKDLGSMLDKVNRQEKIAQILCKDLGGDWDKLKRANELCKCDLVSDMVYEFTNLEGIMGYYYALASGEDDDVALAIKEQYLPRHEGDSLPSSDLGSLLSLSIRIDNLLGLFSVGAIPTGSKDPLALRRSASGLLKIIYASSYELDLDKLFKELSFLYDDFDYTQVISFIHERLFSVLDINASFVRASLASSNKSILAIMQNAKNLHDIFSSNHNKDNFATFKRVANIIKNETSCVVDPSLFVHESEKKLHKAFLLAQNADIEALFALKPQLDELFDNVMINDDDEKIRCNRLGLLQAIYVSFLRFADLKEISV